MTAAPRTRRPPSRKQQWHSCADCLQQTLDASELDADGRCDRCAKLAAKWPGWEPGICEPKEPAGIGHQPTVLVPRGYRQDDELRYRGACFECSWLGPERIDDSNGAVEDAHDHTHPGWRDLPVLPRIQRTGDPNKDAARLAKVCGEVEAIYLLWLGISRDELVHRAWPIRTLRSPVGTRHVPAYSHWGGYDMAVVAAEQTSPTPIAGEQLSLL